MQKIINIINGCAGLTIVFVPMILKTFMHANCAPKIWCIENLIWFDKFFVEINSFIESGIKCERKLLMRHAIFSLATNEGGGRFVNHVAVNAFRVDYVTFTLCLLLKAFGIVLFHEDDNRGKRSFLQSIFAGRVCCCCAGVNN